MKKKYNKIILLVSAVVLVVCYLSVKGYFGNIFIFRYNDFTDSFMLLSASFLLVSLFMFSVTDSVFKKWLKFSSVWLLSSLLAIAMTPRYPRGFIDPDREQVSIWMSSLFLIISIILMIIWSIKEKRKIYQIKSFIFMFVKYVLRHMLYSLYFIVLSKYCTCV